jgi:1-hydroxycarotenoid 3,4-desaturase
VIKGKTGGYGFVRTRVVVVGAGVGGLSAALALAAKGIDVLVLERQPAVGGKMRRVMVDGAGIDGGPTVFTMRWVFDELFAEAGLDFSCLIPHRPAGLLARHAWTNGARLDLHVDPERCFDDIKAFSGAAEAERWRGFMAHARRIYDTLETPFLRGDKPNPVSLTARVGFGKVPALLDLKPFSTLWQALGAHLKDPRLKQLYGRYATYCGSSPFAATATLMLVAHVEQEGVWYVDGGMHELALGLARAAEKAGAEIRTSTEVSEIISGPGGVLGVRLLDGRFEHASDVIVNADANAVASGLFGEEIASAVSATPPAARSLSALVWTAYGSPHGFPLVRHNVLFSNDYADEFQKIFVKRKLPHEPTVYVCAQGRGDAAPETVPDREPLLVLVNAPATGDGPGLSLLEIEQCRERTEELMAAHGLTLSLKAPQAILTGPEEFHRLFPATGGALYGRASHGWMASFQRQGGRTKVPGLYLAGGSVHPGPGVPMAALSGRIAARSVLSARPLTSQSRQAVTSGGTSTA